MKQITLVPLAAAALVLVAPLSAHAALSAYSQNFETLSGSSALSGDGWKVYGNVFNADNSYAYGYGSFPAPNGGPGFSGVDSGQGGAAQGSKQLAVYSDYNNRCRARRRPVG